MRQWIEIEDWSAVSHAESANRKMEILQEMLVSKYHEYFPEKVRSISIDNEPYYSEKLAKLKRKK